VERLSIASTKRRKIELFEAKRKWIAAARLPRNCIDPLP
jgi:hypothetical protein